MGKFISARSADQILVLDQGTIIEQASHEDLLRRRGYYYRMHHAGVGKSV
ncbi:MULTISPECIES: hypothetical protein [unclassified Paenibacillus]|nr:MULTISPECIES: hypothetical protein [unclassified Paenibacillus]MDF9844572.1 ABC-type multidrug transport system fused ATPase/permease subunit [Paenibacillus sp. PastF-2]MDF9851143.1 ABC-type multidrug transport system fused ATPase/permease subunit [Paenibacillus sp. PastM-2]MDF9856222.1 ABC-type multidrug transport system fused ATPase/permease subunit [Paenibacillus sp. PastF-1]MDH6481549.1 ABC-type multidrug transport system fused ATPase/permease subunit [Paenibacillus sp. PastH-2]MDH65104